MLLVSIAAGGGAIRVACASETLEGAARTSLATSGSLTSGRKDPRGQREYCNSLSYPAGRSPEDLQRPCEGGRGRRARAPPTDEGVDDAARERIAVTGALGAIARPPPKLNPKLCCRRTWRRCTRPMPLTSPPYVLLLVVKSGHVGSEWLAELVHKQRFGAFKHEANACVRSQDLVSGLITGAGCSKVSTRDNSSLPLLGLSFNVGAFGESAIATWKAALNATPPTMPIMVVSLTRTNTVKWAWSVYRHQVFDQKSHVRYNDSTPVRRPFEPVRAEPTCIVQD